MSKAKHTQGKWEHCGSNGCKSIFVRHGGRQRTEICDTVGRNEPEDLANARLIAASPEKLPELSVERLAETAYIYAEALMQERERRIK